MENILVAGASGTTGKKIINILKESQYFNPIAMVRNPEQVEFFNKSNVDNVLGDLEQDVSHTLNNIDKVVFAAGSGGKKVIAVDQEGAKKLMDASTKANIKKFVMLSSMGAENPESADDLKEYLQAKHNADEYLKTSNLRYAIIRPGALTNEIGSGKIKIGKSLEISGSISRDDVAQTLVRALHDDTVNNATFEILEGEQLIGKALNSIT